MKLRHIIAAALFVTTATSAYAQDDGAVLMRRPLPTLKGGVTPPSNTDTVYGWYLHCQAPSYADCESITVMPNGEYQYSSASSSFCLVPQSEEKNAIAVAAGDGPPGEYDFEAICSGAPPEPPYEPPVGLVGYGYETDCVNETFTCYRLTTTQQESGWGANWENVDFYNCQDSQSSASQELIEKAGLRPGRIGLYESDAAAYCAAPPSDLMFAWSPDCINNQATSSCMGMDQNSNNWSPFPDAKCNAFTATPTQAAKLESFGVYTSKQAAAASIADWCTGGEAPTTPGPEDGLSTDTGQVEEGPDPTEYVFDPQWEAGPWEGEGGCGIETTMTRSIVCKAQPMCIPRDGGDLCTDPNDYPARVAVPSSMCSSLPMPTTTYTGTQAMCGYTLSFVNGEWQNWDVNADKTCSADSYRDRVPVCRNAQGDSVSLEYCRLNLVRGGTEQNISEREWGNYEGCAYVLEPRKTATQCNGANAYYTVTGADCTRADGYVATGSEATQKCPTDGSIQYPYVVNSGSCEQTYNLSQRGGYMTWCSTESGQGYETLLLGSLPSYSDAQRRAQQLCSAMNATCCQIEYNTGGPTGSGGGAYKIMGTTGPVHIESYGNNWGYEQTGEETHANLPSWTPVN